MFAAAVAFSGIGGALAAAAQAQKHGGHANPYVLLRAMALLYGALILLGVSIGPAFHALMTNLIWRNTRLGDHRIECGLSPLKLVWIAVSNFVLVLVTLGLFVPWAMVAPGKVPVGIHAVVAGPAICRNLSRRSRKRWARSAEEAASVFDFDISL